MGAGRSRQRRMDGCATASFAGAGRIGRRCMRSLARRSRSRDAGGRAHTSGSDHLCPQRAVVPGLYGLVSVRGLPPIQAGREPFQGYWHTSDYGYWDYFDGKPVRRALGEMKLKSEIARPRVYETLVPNRMYTVFGAAWAGETDVTEIAVSTDGGQTWAEAHFLDPGRRHAWRRWKFDWLTPKEPGRYTLLSRAKDANGTVQPDKHDYSYGTYVITHLLPIEVIVEEPVSPER